MTKQYYTYRFLTSKGIGNVFCAVSDKTALEYIREDNEQNPNDLIVRVTNTYTKEIVWGDKDDRS